VLGDVEAGFAGYLDAEKRLGRIKPGADTETLAFTLLGSLHHLFITQAGDPLDPARVRQGRRGLVELGAARSAAGNTVLAAPVGS
jgi:hypothetical protein